MRTLIFLTALFSQQALAAGVDRVVVFADRAEVTRVADGKCENGRASIVLPPLPASLDLRTLRAEVRGKGAIGSLTSKVAPRDPALDDRLKKLRDDRQILMDRRTEMTDQMNVAHARAGTAGSFGGFFSAILKEEVRDAKALPDRWKKSLEFVNDEQVGAKKKALELAVELRKITREIEKLDQKISIAGQFAGGDARNVQLSVDCAGESRAEVEVSYVVPGATWRPEYDLRFFPAAGARVGAGRVELTVGAIVEQATGEDWEDASIVLSTAKPALGGETPIPAPLWIDGYEVETDNVLVQAAEKRETLKDAGQRAGGGAKSAELDDGGKAFTLKLPHRATVRSDARPYWMPVDEIAGKGEAKLVAIPKLRPYVYQVLFVTNPASYGLMAGTVHSYRNGSYVGDTMLEYSAPGEKLEISLGLDEELRVERTDKRAVDKGPTILGSMRRFEREYRIKITNRSKGSQKVEIRDSIPVSKDERIEVQLLSDKTSRGGALDAERGIIRWTVELGRGEEKSIDLGYVIGLPKDWKM